MPDIVSTNSLIDLDPDSFVDLFEIYIDQNYGVIRFHAGKNFNNFLIFKGNKYIAAPIEYSGFEFLSDGRQNRPTIRIANINGIITNVIKNKSDLVNSKIKRIKVFVKNLDDENFSDQKNPFFGYRSKRNSTMGYGKPFFEETYIINKKTSENKYVVEFELSSPIDFENQFIPNRKISDNMCPWSYRGCGCNYGKIPWKSDLGADQTVLVNNISKSSSDIWGANKLNLGIPLADDSDKMFFDANGYGLTSINYKGFWDPSTSYVAGDFVSYSDSVGYDFFGSKFQASESSISDSIYICIKENTTKDPKSSKEYWAKDACSKTLKGCSIRWVGHKDGLPFGGFPGTKPYNYQT
jgi:lambda family phage minor tail protein L